MYFIILNRLLSRSAFTPVNSSITAVHSHVIAQCVMITTPPSGRGRKTEHTTVHETQKIPTLDILSMAIKRVWDPTNSILTSPWNPVPRNPNPSPSDPRHFRGWLNHTSRAFYANPKTRTRVVAILDPNLRLLCRSPLQQIKTLLAQTSRRQTSSRPWVVGTNPMSMRPT